jgi:hypothetical protein
MEARMPSFEDGNWERHSTFARMRMPHSRLPKIFSGFILDNDKICKIEAIFSYFHKKGIE